MNAPNGGEEVEQNTGSVIIWLDATWSFWQRLSRYDHGVAIHGSFDDYLSDLATKGDKPLRLETYLDFLSDAGLDAACLHVHADRAIIGAVRL